MVPGKIGITFLAEEVSPYHGVSLMTLESNLYIVQACSRKANNLTNLGM
jgi:hypothetical protein